MEAVWWIVNTNNKPVHARPFAKLGDKPGLAEKLRTSLITQTEPETRLDAPAQREMQDPSFWRRVWDVT